MSRRRDGHNGYSRRRSRSRSRSPRRRISPHRSSAVGRHRDMAERKRETGYRDRRSDCRDTVRGGGLHRDRRGRSAENVRERHRDDRSRERPGRDAHRDSRRDHRDNADLRTFISGRVTYDDPATRLSSQNDPEDSRRRFSPSPPRGAGGRSRFSRYDRGQDWSRGRGRMRGEDQRERIGSTGSLNLNPTDIPRSDRYFEHDNREDEQGGRGEERRRRGSSLRDCAPGDTPAKWGHDMFDRYYGEGQSPSSTATDDEQDGTNQAPKSLVSKVSNDASVTPLSMNWEGGMDVFVMDDDTNQDDQKEAA